VATQKKLLTKTAKEKGYTNLLTFCDDGISGVTMNRPGYQEMIAELSKGYIGAVFVKDLSRLGRNYIEVGKLTEDFLPSHDIRLVAVSDGVDTDEGENDLNPIRNLFNEWYSRDISRKKRISNKVKGNSGEPLAPPPYGYKRDEGNPKFWVIDPEAAEVVKRIYQMSIDGKGTEQIAAALTQDKILTPIHYCRAKGISRPAYTSGREPYFWSTATVIKILTLQEYCGDVVNFKTYSKSYKHKTRIRNEAENMAVFTEVHEPIIERATWERIQEKRKSKTRKRKANDGEKSIFSGLLVCADCGNNLWYHFNQVNCDITYFNCSNYKSNRGGTCPTTHYIRVDFIEQVILQEIRRLTRYAVQHEADFAALVMGHSQHADASQRERKQKELYAMTARDRELDRLFSRMYEDNIAGKIDDDRFGRLSSQYTAEQKELAESVKAISAELDRQDGRAMTTDMFISTVRKYTRAKKLTERMLNELIERIEVHHIEKTDGAYIQRVTIHYNCVGTLTLPASFFTPEVAVNTRKGVTVNYSPLQQAV
jgi:DNA invertase Pin-like site-specific DNA recombinase